VPNDISSLTGGEKMLRNKQLLVLLSIVLLVTTVLIGALAAKPWPRS